MIARIHCNAQFQLLSHPQCTVLIRYDHNIQVRKLTVLLLHVPQTVLVHQPEPAPY